jgi:hypothetical protein
VLGVGHPRRLQRIGLAAATDRGDVGGIVGARYLRDVRTFHSRDVGSGPAEPIDVAEVFDASAGRLLAGASHA